MVTGLDPTAEPTALETKEFFRYLAMAPKVLSTPLGIFNNPAIPGIETMFHVR